MKSVSLFAVDYSHGGPNKLVAVLTLDSHGHVVCDPLGGLDGLLRDGWLDMVPRPLCFRDGAAFLRAIAHYPIGGYCYTRIEE